MWISNDYNTATAMSGWFILTERTSTWRITKWRVKESAIEPISHMFCHGGIEMSDWFSDKLKMKVNKCICNWFVLFVSSVPVEFTCSSHSTFQLLPIQTRPWSLGEDHWIFCNQRHGIHRLHRYMPNDGSIANMSTVVHFQRTRTTR